MRIYSLLAAIILTLTGCAATINLTKEERQSIKAVSIDQPTMYDKALAIRALLFAKQWKGVYKGEKYNSYQELFPLVLKSSNIDIKEIVYKELVKQIDSVGVLKRVDSNGDFVVKTRILQYGYHSPPFTMSLAPRIALNLKGTLGNGKQVWESQGKVSPFSSDSPSHDPKDLVNKPEMIRQDFEKLSAIAIKEALQSYIDQIAHTPPSN